MKVKFKVYHENQKRKNFLLRRIKGICNNSCHNNHLNHFFGPLTTPAEIIAQMTFHDIGDIGVAIFLMISGALLLNRDYPSLSDFLKRRFARIVYPFIFWIILILGQLYFQIQLKIHLERIYRRALNHMVFLDANWNLSIHTRHQFIR